MDIKVVGYTVIFCGISQLIGVNVPMVTSA